MAEETDKVLEAEASIQKIAEELARMRNAANLLEYAQNQNDIVLKTAETVISEIQNLISTFKEVVSNLSSLNINQRLTELEKQVQTLTEFTQIHVEDTSEMLSKAGTDLDQLREFTQNTAKNNSNAMELLNAGQEDIDEKLVATSKLLTQLTQKRGLFSLLKKRKKQT